MSNTTDLYEQGPRAVHLTSMTATCSLCGHKVSQIDTNREHADEVVNRGMDRHLAEAHGVDRYGDPITTQETDHG